MSSNPQKSQKMCKSPTKMAVYQKTDKPKELGSYEVMNTNCTMVGSNNLNLDSKINYLAPQIKICTKPAKTNSDVIKKPQSPRLDTYTIQSPKFPPSPSYHIRSQVPLHSPSYSKTFDNPTFQTTRLPITKSPVPTFSAIPNSHNGGPMCSMSPSTYSNPSPSYPSNSVSPYNVQISSPANSVSSITSGVASIKSPVPSPQNIRPPTPQPILPQVSTL